MAKPRKTGKPRAQEEDDEAEETRSAFAEESLDSFLRDMHDESTESANTESQAGADADPNRLPSLGWLKEHFKTKSATIRYLVIDRKFPVAKVARHLNLKYQHVRNVSKQTLKRGPNEDFHLEEGQKASQIKTDD